MFAFWIGYPGTHRWNSEGHLRTEDGRKPYVASSGGEAHCTVEAVMIRKSKPTESKTFSDNNEFLRV
jgi:hypothetical protein